MGNRGVKVVDRSRVNPFGVSVLPKVRSMAIGVGGVVMNGTGERVMGEMMFMKNVVLDGGSFIKVYDGGLRVMFRMKPNDIKVLCYILLNRVKFGSDSFLMGGMTSVEDCGMSISSFYKAVNNLKKLGVIARGMDDGSWWLNTNMFFRGVYKKGGWKSNKGLGVTKKGSAASMEMEDMYTNKVREIEREAKKGDSVRYGSVVKREDMGGGVNYDNDVDNIDIIS